MADRHSEPDTLELRTRLKHLAVRGLRLAIALPVVALMIGFAKMTQYAAIEAFGDQLGPTLSAFLGVVPVFALYYWAAIKLPKLNSYGLSRG